MNQSQFEELHQEQWHGFQRLLEALENKSVGVKDVSATDLPTHYRQLCNHYGLAQARHYSPALVDRLHNLVLRGHRQLYKKKTALIWTSLNFLGRDFPQTVRRHWLAFWLAFLLFYGPAAFIGIATYRNPTLIYSVMDERQVVQMESMYDPDNKKIGRSATRDSETDLAMFGHYILNNISIGFRTFAGGIVFGLGSIFLLVFNGVMIGGVAGHLSHPPFSSMFWPFVSGHGAFELTAIVISGAAGLLLGFSLLRPGRYKRADALRIQAPAALKLVMGAAVFLLFAAFIEAFWSSSFLSPAIKYAMAACNWTVVFLYLGFAGKERHGP